jgi:hypothetical protein
MRKETDEQHDIERGAAGLHPAQINIHDVADPLKGEEGDPEREEQVRNRKAEGEPDSTEKSVQVAAEESGVLEKPEGREIENDSCNQNPFSGERAEWPLAFEMVDSEADPVIEEGASDQKGEKLRIPAAVEYPGAEKEKRFLHGIKVVQSPADHEDRKKEDPELKGGEEHAQPYRYEIDKN